jgi:hypothetical protein
MTTVTGPTYHPSYDGVADGVALRFENRKREAGRGHCERRCAAPEKATAMSGITLDYGCDFNDDGSVTERGSGVVIVPADRDVIPAAQGPLPEVGTEAFRALMDRCASAHAYTFSSKVVADVAGWWARLHNFGSATLHHTGNGRVMVWE